MIRKMMGEELLKDMAKDGCIACDPNDNLPLNNFSDN